MHVSLKPHAQANACAPVVAGAAPHPTYRTYFNAMARRQWSTVFALVLAAFTAAVSGSSLLMPTCSMSGDCADEDGASMLQTSGGIQKLSEPRQEELLAEEDEEADGEAPAAESLTAEVPKDGA
mmetsp:Transcript_72629/g.224586  ORF Transcript_72629/g.224586 Transcript_72629/m.224586 type:complete len:124 (+) Transcript_72629:29-400(+)